MAGRTIRLLTVGGRNQVYGRSRNSAVCNVPRGTCARQTTDGQGRLVSDLAGRCRSLPLDQSQGPLAYQDPFADGGQSAHDRLLTVAEQPFADAGQSAKNRLVTVLPRKNPAKNNLP